MHNRPIHVRCDDSVTRVIGESESPMRRSRAMRPSRSTLPVVVPIADPGGGRAIEGRPSACGSDRHAILSQHLGDLDHLQGLCASSATSRLYEKLFGLTPGAHIAHDLHPDYASTRYAANAPGGRLMRIAAVQHHHAAHGQLHGRARTERAGDRRDFRRHGLWTGRRDLGRGISGRGLSDSERAAHLRYVAMPGGEQAVREPWRMAAAYLFDAEASCSALNGGIPPRGCASIAAKCSSES